MNKVMLIGRLTKDAELIVLNSSSRNGLKCTLAIDRQYKNSNGEKETDFVPVAYFTEHTNKLMEYLTKGRLVSVSGKIRVKSLEDANGKRSYFTNIEADRIDFLDSKKSNAI